MLSNPLETLSYYKHGEQRCQPAPCASTYRPTPSLQAHTSPQPSPQCSHSSHDQTRGGGSPGKPCSACRPPNTPRATTKCNYALYSFIYAVVYSSRSYTPFPLPTPLQYYSWKNRIKGVLFFNWVSGAAVLALAGGLFETLLTWASVATGLTTLILLAKQPNNSNDFAAALQGSAATNQALTARPVNTRRTQAFFFLFFFFFLNLNLLRTR